MLYNSYECEFPGYDEAPVLMLRANESTKFNHFTR